MQRRQPRYTLTDTLCPYTTLCRSKQCSRLMTTITALPQPVIAKVHGIATAAGCQLVATCDLAVADRSAQFGTPGVNIGLFCSTQMVALSRSEEHTSELQSLMRISSAVFCLKKKTTKSNIHSH